MGLLDKFRSKANPVEVWRADAASVSNLDFDFSTHSLCGIKLGDSTPLLWKLGPPGDKSGSRSGAFNYYAKGFQAGVADGLISGFTFFWNETLHRPFKIFQGVCRYRGQILPLKAGTPELEIQKIFGEPYWRDEDGDEIILFYEFKNLEWQIELTKRDGLTTILVVSPPLLADPEKRKAYRVAKPWL